MKIADKTHGKIKEIISGLNNQQQKAVTYPFKNHCLVLAGAGCGKTSVLTRRIAYCALTHCPQDRILALTFTRKAADEMRQRLVLLPGIAGDKPLPLVTTFHGCGLRILKDTVDGIPNAGRLGFTGEPVLLTCRDRLALLAECSSLEERRALQTNIMELDDLLARESVNPRKNAHLSPESHALLDTVKTRFRKKKREAGFWEFSDMIQETVRLLSENPDVKNHYRKKYAYILVDEFQDTNPLQITLLNHLLSEENRLFAVGDDDQAIYGFRGADIGPIMQFGDHFPGAEVIKLEMNYRSTPAILKSANAIFKNKPLQFRKVLVSGKYAAGKGKRYPKPVKKHCSTTADMVQWIVNKAEALEKETDIAVSSMALLFRLNESLDRVKEELTNGRHCLSANPSCLTVHGSKGLEFPVVFLCDLEESIFPHYKVQRSRKIRTWMDVLKRVVIGRKSTAPQCDLDEEQRLFYVGVTRAEKILFLLSVKNKEYNRRKIVMKPSRFLDLI